MVHERSEGAQGAGPGEGEEIADGSSSKTESSTTTSAPSGLEHPDGPLAGCGDLGVDGRVPSARAYAIRTGTCGSSRRRATTPRVEGGSGGRSDRDRRPRRGRGRRRRCDWPWARSSRGLTPSGRVGAPAGDPAQARLHAREPATGRGNRDGAPPSEPVAKDHARRQRGPSTARGASPGPGWVEGFSEGRRWRWSCCPSSRIQVCWSSRPRRIRPPAAGRRKGRRRWPRVIGMECRSIRRGVADGVLRACSFPPIGIPASGPASPPPPIWASTASASANSRSPSLATKALYMGLSRSIRSRAALASSSRALTSFGRHGADRARPATCGGSRSLSCLRPVRRTRAGPIQPTGTGRPRPPPGRRRSE